MAHCNGNWQSLVGMSSGQGDRWQCFRRAAFLAQASYKSHVSTHTTAARRVPSRRWNGERGTELPANWVNNWILLFVCIANRLPPVSCILIAVN